VDKALQSGDLALHDGDLGACGAEVAVLLVELADATAAVAERLAAPDVVGDTENEPLLDGVPESVGDGVCVPESVGEKDGVPLGDAPVDSVAVAVSLKVAVVDGELDGVGLVVRVWLFVCEFVGETDRDDVTVPDGDGVPTGVPLGVAPVESVPVLDAVGLGDGATTPWM
jgi:hypothetical protein